jgi:hypothetical protein
MRDSQIALGTRKSTRMTRMKDVDFDVPMLQLADFKLETLPDSPCCIPVDCKVMRDTELQRQLAVMCIEMAKLCMCISHILSVQHGVTSSKASTWTATMLFAESLEPGDDQIQASAKALQEWKDRFPAEAQNVMPTLHNVDSSKRCLVLNRAFLHMLYYTALSSLHRSQPPAPTGTLPRAPSSKVFDVSCEALRLAATKITEIAGALQNMDLARYLPSPCITVLLHAIVTHLLDVLAPGGSLRLTSLEGFCKCMQIMGALRDVYAAADYATAFLQSAIQTAEIGPVTPQTNEDRGSCDLITSTQNSTRTGLQVHPAGLSPDSGLMALSPANQVMNLITQQNNGTPVSDALESGNNIHRRRNSSLVSANVSTDLHVDRRQHVNCISLYSQNLALDSLETAINATAMDINTSNSARISDHMNIFELNFDNTTNLGAAGRMFNVENGGFVAMQGDNGDFSLDTNWLMEMSGGEGLMLGERREGFPASEMMAFKPVRLTSR